MKGGLLGRPRTIITEDIRTGCERLGSRNKTAEPAYTVRASSYTTDAVRGSTEKLKLKTPSGLVFRVKSRNKQ